MTEQPDFFNHFINTSKDIMKTTGKHIPQIFFIKNNEITSLILEFDEETKDKAVESSRNIFNLIKPDSYYFISEYWMSELKEGQAYVRPRNDSNRKEVIIVIEFKSDLVVNMCIIPIIRNGEEISFGENKIINNDNSGSTLWNFYLEEEGVKEHMDININEMQEKFINKRSMELAKKYSKRLMGMNPHSPEFEQISKEMYDDVIKIKKELKGGDIDDI